LAIKSKDNMIFFTFKDLKYNDYNDFQLTGIRDKLFDCGFWILDIGLKRKHIIAFDSK